LIPDEDVSGNIGNHVVAVLRPDEIQICILRIFSQEGPDPGGGLRFAPASVWVP